VREKLRLYVSSLIAFDQDYFLEILVDNLLPIIDEARLDDWFKKHDNVVQLTPQQIGGPI
jgi:hypothetical protein